LESVLVLTGWHQCQLFKVEICVGR
jgi:hypothetical protein